MTREEKIEWLESIPGETISPYQLSVVYGGDSYGYNLSAKDGTFTLPHLWRGRNLRILKEPVIQLLGGHSNDRIQADKNDHGTETVRADEP